MEVHGSRGGELLHGVSRLEKAARILREANGFDSQTRGVLLQEWLRRRWEDAHIEW